MHIAIGYSDSDSTFYAFKPDLLTKPPQSLTPRHAYNVSTQNSQPRSCEHVCVCFVETPDRQDARVLV